MARQFMIETSARHIHVTKEHLEILFGKGAVLHNKKELSQPGQFACEERLTVSGPKGEIKNISVLGPVRPATQVEISATDARSIGIIAPVRESGDVQNSGGCTLTGPCGQVELEQGVIVAKRHIHLRPQDAEEMGVCDKQTVCVKTNTADRNTIFCDVVVRVSPNFMPAMHIDTDESNAAAVNRDTMGEIVECG